MKTIIAVLLTFVNFSLHAGLLNNSFEGNTSYIRGFKKLSLKSFYKKTTEHLRNDLLSLDLTYQDSCEFSILDKISKVLDEHNYKKVKKSYKQSLLFLRKENVIDDTVWRLSYKSVGAYTLKFKSKFAVHISDRSGSASIDSAIFQEFKTSIDKGTCPTKAFQKLVSSKSLTSALKIKDAALEAYRLKLISSKDYWLVKLLSNDKFFKEKLILQEYISKLDFLDRQFKDRRPEEFSDFVSQKVSKNRLSMRERLFVRYSKFQIVSMRKLITNLMNRLNADSVTIHVELDDQVIEVITLDPLEQYRFSAKMIRKEISLLTQTRLFGGNEIFFTDLLAASFETGLITSLELRYLSEIEELWNKKLSKRENILRFLKKYSSLFLVALPPNLYIVRVLAMVGLETLMDDDNDPNREHSIF